MVLNTILLKHIPMVSGLEMFLTIRNEAKKIGVGQSWFPKLWTEKDIRHAGEHVAGLKSNRHVADGETIYGNYKGVRVGVKRTHGKIATVFPDADQSSVVKRRHRK
jgi:hypothetical protein